MTRVLILACRSKLLAVSEKGESFLMSFPLLIGHGSHHMGLYIRDQIKISLSLKTSTF